MARGVSGALSRLAKTGALAPVRGAVARDPGAVRRSPRDEEEEDFVFLPDDLEELSALQARRRKAEAARLAALGASPAAAPAPAAPAAPPVIVAPQVVAVANAAAAATAVSAGPGMAPRAPQASPQPGRRERRVFDRFEPPAPRPRWNDADEDEDEDDDGAGRPAGARLRRIRTTLVSRSGDAPGRDGKPCARAQDADERERDRDIRASWRPKQLARLRRRLGMTQEEFARCYGLDVKDIARWEEGQRPGRSERVLLTLIMHDPEEVARLVDEAMPFE